VQRRFGAVATAKEDRQVSKLVSIRGDFGQFPCKGFQGSEKARIVIPGGLAIRAFLIFSGERVHTFRRFPDLLASSR